MSSVSSGKLSGRMIYLISLPLTLIWSRLICDPPFGVILAARKLVFIWGLTEAIVPLMMVPIRLVSLATVSTHRADVVIADYEDVRTGLQLNGHRLI